MSATAVPSRRDARFDSLRGLMLVAMTVNHLPSSLRFLTDQSLGIWTSAEGFIFLSGLLAGMVYTRRRRRDGPAILHEATRARTTMIYSWHLGSFLAAMAAVRATSVIAGFCSRTAPQLFYSHPWLALLLGSTMLYQPGMLDILPLYCAFVAALPYVLDALEAGRRRWVLAISGALWLAVQGAPSIDRAPLYPIHVGSFNLLAWQFLFFTGVVIGHAMETEPGPQVRPRPGLIAGCAAIALFGWGIHHAQWRAPWPDWIYGISLNKPALGFLRLGDFAAVSYLVALIGTSFPVLLHWPPLAFLGRHSIAVVAVQSVAGILLLEFPALFSSRWRDWTTTTAAILLLFAAAAVHEAWQRRSRSRGGPGMRRSRIGARQTRLLPLSRADDVRAA